MTKTIAQTTNEPIGVILKESREKLGLSREEVASRTRIPTRYVAVLEDGPEDQEVGMDAYTKIYLKAYGKFLGLDVRSLIVSYADETHRSQTTRHQATGRKHPLKAVPSSRLTSGPKIIRIGLGVLIVVAVAAYFISALQNLVAPPAITVLSPKDGIVTTDRTITIEGRTDNEVALTINGKSVGIDNEGRFTDAIDLQEGLNVVRVIGIRKHSKEMVIERRVIVTSRERQAASLAPFDGVQE